MGLRRDEAEKIKIQVNAGREEAVKPLTVFFIGSQPGVILARRGQMAVSRDILVVTVRSEKAATVGIY